MNNVELVHSYLSSFETGNPDAVVRHVVDNFQNIQVAVLGSGCSGKALYRERLVKFLQVFENLRYRVDELIVDGDRAAATYEMQFNREGRLIKIPGVMIFEFQEGLISVRKDYWDGLSYQEQTASALSG